MRIEVEIFDDGREPVTCCRNMAGGLFCQFLRVGRFGTTYSCKLFQEVGKEKLYPYGGDVYGFLEPCQACLDARRGGK